MVVYQVTEARTEDAVLHSLCRSNITVCVLWFLLISVLN